ncbi:hypothetical protein ID866_4972 [Astraeus odoratus]|nr:hypothetical protein ID866_4972 [Astraeus odoratus]
MAAPPNPQAAALLAHISSQMQLNVAFLESQNYLSAQDAATMKEIIQRLPGPPTVVVSVKADVPAMQATSTAVRTVPPTPTPAEPPRTDHPRARAIWDYNKDGSEPQDLSFAADDIIEIIEETNEDWWRGRVQGSGREALFPSNYVEVINTSKVTPAAPSEKAYRPFGAALHGMDVPPPAGSGVNSIGLQQSTEQGDKKNKFGKYGNTMAHSAAGGLGFGAGALLLACFVRDIDASLSVGAAIGGGSPPNKLLPTADSPSSCVVVHRLSRFLMIISKPAIIFHTSQAFFNFLAMACFASVASFQAKWGIGPSGLSGFAIFVSVTGIFLSLFMLFVPVVYEKYDRFVKLAIALREVRVGFILTGTGCTFSLLIAFITTISAWTEAGCKDASNDPHASLGSDFVAGLPGWCSTKKAGSIFFWLAFGFWLASLGLLIVDWRSGNLTQRPRDPPFRRPDVEEVEEEDQESTAYQPVGSAAPPPVTTVPKITTTIPSVATATPRQSTYDDSNGANSPFSDSNRFSGAFSAAPAPASTVYPNSGYRNSGYSGYSTPPAATSRHSVDAYGAFSDPSPTGFGGATSSYALPPTADPNTPRVSRTMQYADPYAAVRASISASTTSTAPPSYTYTGY